MRGDLIVIMWLSFFDTTDTIIQYRVSFFIGERACNLLLVRLGQTTIKSSKPVHFYLFRTYICFYKSIKLLLPSTFMLS